MSRRTRVVAIIGGLAAVALIAVVIVFGVIGVSQTVRSGGQATMCGVQVGVTASDQSVRLSGISNERLAPGDRVQVNALCVVEVVRIDERTSASDADGGGASVELRYRLW